MAKILPGVPISRLLAVFTVKVGTCLALSHNSVLNVKVLVGICNQSPSGFLHDCEIFTNLCFELYCPPSWLTLDTCCSPPPRPSSSGPAPRPAPRTGRSQPPRRRSQCPPPGGSGGWRRSPSHTWSPCWHLSPPEHQVLRTIKFRIL